MHIQTSHLLQKKTLQIFSETSSSETSILRTSHFKAQVSWVKLEAYSPQSVIFTHLDIYDSTPLMGKWTIESQMQKATIESQNKLSPKIH